MRNEILESNGEFILMCKKLQIAVIVHLDCPRSKGYVNLYPM